MKCQARLKVKDNVLECDWPTEHETCWAHVNKNSQTLWGDNGIKYSSRFLLEMYWDAIPEEMKSLLNKPTTANMMWQGQG